MSDAMIASFILRFTQEQPSHTRSAVGAWRGVIRHVQTEEEIHFLRILDALAFIARYVDISDQIMNITKGEEECD